MRFYHMNDEPQFIDLGLYRWPDTMPHQPNSTDRLQSRPVSDFPNRPGDTDFDYKGRDFAPTHRIKPFWLSNTVDDHFNAPSIDTCAECGDQFDSDLQVLDGDDLCATCRQFHNSYESKGGRNEP